jgi:hypothetical protein
LGVYLYFDEGEYDDNTPEILVDTCLEAVYYMNDKSKEDYSSMKSFDSSRNNSLNSVATEKHHSHCRNSFND